MTHKPNHSCFTFRPECAGCAFELGQMLAKKKPTAHATHVWMITGSDYPCDIRRYAFSHKEAVEQLAHAKKRRYRDTATGGTWTLFKLVRVTRNP